MCLESALKETCPKQKQGYPQNGNFNPGNEFQLGTN